MSLSVLSLLKSGKIGRRLMADFIIAKSEVQV